VLVLNPCFFLDYYSTGKLEQKAAREFLDGVRQACLDSEMALIGGETAEMPDIYSAGEFDCAGFSVGVVDREKAYGAHRVSSGDHLIWVASSGFHSNGYSLLRKVFAEDLADHQQELMTPTALYPQLITALKSDAVTVSAIANITGGGMDNIPRVLPDNLLAELEPWQLPSGFLRVKKRAELEWPSLLRTLNCGIGLVLIVPHTQAEKVRLVCENQGFASGDLGKVREVGDSDDSESKARRWTLDFEMMQKFNDSAMKDLD
jgi:phosphoribosylformylglycinamidine cyclo-ligase